MNYSKEQTKRNLEMVRTVMIRYPRATVREIAEGTGFSIDYSNKLQRKIIGQRANIQNWMSLNRDLARIVETVDDSIGQLWYVIRDASSTKKDKILALKEIREQMQFKLESMFNAGYYAKHLGEVEIKQAQTIVEIVRVAIAEGRTERLPEHYADATESVLQQSIGLQPVAETAGDQ